MLKISEPDIGNQKVKALQKAEMERTLMSDVLLTTAEPGGPQLTGTLTDVEAAGPIVEFVGAINSGDVDAAISQLAPDAIHHGKVSNYRPEGVRVLFNLLRTVLPDLRLDIRDMQVDGNRVITRIVATGTHTGSYLGKSPTGRPVAWESTDIAEIGVVDGDDASYRRVLKRFWDIWNDPKLWKELGFIPAIAC